MPKSMGMGLWHQHGATGKLSTSLEPGKHEAAVPWLSLPSREHNILRNLTHLKVRSPFVWQLCDRTECMNEER